MTDEMKDRVNRLKGTLPEWIRKAKRKLEKNQDNMTEREIKKLKSWIEIMQDFLKRIRK